MSIENVKKELNSLIKDFKKEVENENKSEIKSSNYAVLFQRLEEVKRLKSEIEEAGTAAEEMVEFYSFQIEQLKLPIL